MRAVFFILIILHPLITCAQEKSIPVTRDAGGIFSLGMRTTISAFGDEGFAGFGSGGQFRIRLSKNLNTEWYVDYMTTDIGGLGRRYDSHIGWSVMFYPLNKEIGQGILTPYILGGHCFDYTKVAKNASLDPDPKRWSSAVQMGLGTHYNLTEKFDISLSAQYMLHLGNDIQATITRVNDADYLYITQDDLSLEGHLLITLSLNYQIADLW